MIIVMKFNASEAEVAAVIAYIRSAGLTEHVSRGAELVIIGAIGDEDALNAARFEMLPGVDRVSRVTKQYRIVARDTHPAGSVVKIRGIPLGGQQIQVFVGSSSIENTAQMSALAQGIVDLACPFLWGDIAQTLDGPYQLQGTEHDNLSLLQSVASQFKLPFAAELVDLQMLDDLMAHDVDLIQVGAGQMQNRILLKELGRINKPILLRRGHAATLAEWLMAAEYIAAGGNHHIVFCEHGARALGSEVRNVLDVATIAWLKQETHLPVVVDASSAAGKSWLVPPLAQAAVAAGADGIWLDVHPNPNAAWRNADQSLDLCQLTTLMLTLRAIAPALNRTI
ncbi:N-acetylneuraminate synthase family protein [Deefgea sp. CFH1-16]|uniref:N-acetylneuraminate synthase family protein n=1 Tax=Deefgea sp. CFH1-16 TaxID=2675457 RepID=UPI0015F50BF2|nr:N-acetylneuraminate synthase family protein [Deefgea sp. CFH1-16]MBM5575660.1 3-deoxy-7-phosphoheptulonate synthase [Deefgea sp. CFH1-16]